MFTRNWYRVLSSVLANQSTVGIGYNNSERNINADQARDMVRIGYSYEGYSYASLFKVRTSYTGNGGVIFGTGTTPPTIDDYKLESEIISTISGSASVTPTFDDTGMTLTAIYALTNTGSADITIGEIGLIASGMSSQDWYLKMLLERTVLDTPLTIPAGDIGKVTYTIRINYPA